MTGPGLVWLLVTGSRTFTDHGLVIRTLSGIRSELGVVGDQVVVVHGAQGTRDREGRAVKGLDLIAHDAALGLGMRPVAVPAVWGMCGPTCVPAHRRPSVGGRGSYCPTAGFRRNQVMVDLPVGYFCCFGFPVGLSRGTRDCMRRAAEAGIRVVNCTETRPG